jgi:FAD:protein FMN transferase
MNEIQQNRWQIGRRKFLQIIALAGAAGGLYQFGLLGGTSGGKVVRQSRPMMGTEINLIVCGPDEDACLETVRSTLGRMEALERVLSRHQADSELSRLNREGVLPAASADLSAVLNLAGDISRRTEGAFDITVLPLLQLYGRDRLPARDELSRCLALVDYRGIERQGPGLALARSGMGITLDGIAKGYIVDQGVAALRQNGFDNVYVEAGGDLMVSGAKPAGQPWRIGVRQPRPEADWHMPVIATTAPLAIATSGDYMQAFTDDLRHHHILDPRTGMSSPELASSTVTAPAAALADALATAAMVLGPERALAVIETFDGCEGLFVGKDLRRYRTSGFQG